MQPAKGLLAALVLATVLLGSPPAVMAQPLPGGGGEQPSLAPLVEQISPAVVNIFTRGTVDVQQHPLLQHPFFREFFDAPEMPRQRQVRSLGSGVIVNAGEGLVLTNHHVIADADQITVGLVDGRQFEAELIGSDPETDIAVIRIPAEQLQQVEMGNSDTLRSGDFVLAIGNPFGLEHTVTSGIVSALGRNLPGAGGEASIQHFIQTDASINPGNSGGALVSLQGELMGINTAILSGRGGNIGIGFAVPVNIAKTVMAQLVEHGEVRRGVLGVQIQDLVPELADAMGLEQQRGALVSRVVPDSAADRAGLRQGDVITAVDDEPVENANDLVRTIGLLEVGTEISLQILRDGSQQTVTAQLRGAQQRQEQQQAATDEPEPGPLSGVSVTELDQRPPQLDLPDDVTGVLVVEVQPGAPAALQLQPGDVITSVNNQPVSSVDELRQAVAGAEQLVLHIRRGDAAQFVLLE